MSNLNHQCSEPDNTQPATAPQDITKLVMSIINGDQENYNLLKLLDNSIRKSTSLDHDTALTLSFLTNEIEHQADLNDQLDALTFDQGTPALALSSTGKVLGYNNAAKQAFGLRKDQSVFDLGVVPVDFKNFKDRTIQFQTPSILQFHSKAQALLVFTGRYQSDHQLFLLRETGIQWTDAMDTALHDIFNLTEAERDVLIYMARGFVAEQISAERQSKVSTVRQQIKSILQKLGVNSQVQATALAAALGNQESNEHNQKAFFPNENPPSANAADQARNCLAQEHFIRDNRRVGWRRFGKKGGKPVLLMHSTYFGAGTYAPERINAYQAGLDVVIVERPGYGKTQAPLSTTTDSILETHTKDCAELLKQLGWEKVWLKSHDFGLVNALSFANRYSDIVLGLYAISPPPLFSTDSNLSAIPIQQRAFIWAAQHAFWMIKLLLRLSHVKSRKLGPSRWMEMVFDGTPEELNIFQTEAGKELSESSYHFNLVQNSKGQIFDLQASVTNDWSPLLIEASIPLAGLAGQKNTTFDIRNVRELTSQKNTFDIQEISSASLTLALTETENCFHNFLSFIETTLIDN